MKIICHGGAGHTPKVQDGVDKAAEEGWKILKETDNPTLAATAASVCTRPSSRRQLPVPALNLKSSSITIVAAVAAKVGLSVFFRIFQPSSAALSTPSWTFGV